MTATDVLCRMLDERGVEYEGGKRSVRWRDRNGVMMQAFPLANGELGMDVWSCTPEQAIAATLGPKVTGNTSDGYHTFNELYHHRAVLFSVIVRDHRELAWKSMRHHDGTMYDGMFIVGIETPEGQATYHYDIDPYWDMFNCKELDQAPEWDGHTPSEAIERISTLGSSNVGRYVGLRQGEYWERTENSNYYCGGCGWKVTDHDSYCPECGGALHNATLRTCHNVWDIELTGRLRFQCSECGGVSLEIKPNFCPVCGRKVVKPTTNNVDAEEDE